MVWGVFDWSEQPPEKSADEASEADYPECDYDTNLTPLYEAIEERAWIAVNQFLHSGYWPESLFADTMNPEDQARTWVTRYETRPDGSKKVRWSQLPIHAAVIFGAPSVVIQQLVEAFPQSVRCTDDHRMLPLHLAFRHGSDDSVLALFLEEFPEAVNVRGYKGRLPVECAQKGPNPERGAIIQTILHKNQSVWERKKSAVQLKELYCIKEALKIKSQKVSHLETAIREIKSREHKTRKELGATMTELKTAKIKTKVDDENQTDGDKSAERQAVKQLVEKLAALEMATKDLVDKEKSTKKELKKTLAELEATKKMKPTVDQMDQFAKLEKVASHDETNKLTRNAGDSQFNLKRSSSKASVDDGRGKIEPSKSIEVPLSILKKVEQSKKEATSKKSRKSSKNDGTAEEVTLQVWSIKADVASALSPQRDVTTAEKTAATPVTEATTPKTAETKKSSESKKSSKKAAETKKAEEKKAKKAAEAKKAEEKKAKKAQKKKTEARLFQKAEAMLFKKADESESIGSKSSATPATGDHTITSAPVTVTSAPSLPSLVMSASRELEKKKLRKVEETNQALEEKIAELEARQLKEMELRKAEEAKAKEVEKQEIRKIEETNEALVKQIAALAATMKEYEGKQAKAQEELDAVSVPDDGEKKLSDLQTEQMFAIQTEMKEMKETSGKTKGELEIAIRKLEELKADQEATTAAALIEKSELTKEAEETNKKLEKKVAILELALRQFEDKSSLAKTEMNTLKEAIMQDTDVKLTAAQQRYMSRLEDSMKKLEKNARKTKRELDNALGDLDTMKVKELENAQLLAAVEKEKFRSVEQTNKALEEKIRILDYTMQCFEDKATKTKEEMQKAMEDLKKADDESVISGEPLKLTKKQKQHMSALEGVMNKLEERAIGTKGELDEALGELRDLKKADEVAYVRNQALGKRENKAMKDLSKKVQALQTAMVGFEVKETRTMQELEKAMEELEAVSNKRFEVLSMAAEKAEVLATDNAFTKEVVKLEKRATKEEKRIAELEKAVHEVMTKSGTTKEELERTQNLLIEVQANEEARDPPLTKAEKEEVKTEKKLVKDLTKKVATLQSAVIGFEVKETRTMKELEQTMKQLEELTSKRFEVLEQAAVLKEKDTEKLAAAGALAEEKVAALHTAMRELEENATQTHQELDKTKTELENMRTANESGDGTNKKAMANQDSQIKELNEKITVLQQAVMGFEVKETKTMQELEQTMKQLEELTAKRFEVLQKVAGREIEAAKKAEADKYTKKAAQEEKKVAALEFAMRELESKAYKTKLELERTMKGLEHLEEKQEVSVKELSGVTNEDKLVMRELVNKVADIQDAVMAYDEKEHKTTQELERTKQELEATKNEVEDLRAKQADAVIEKQQDIIISSDDNQSEVEAVEVNEGTESDESKEATETAKRVTEETLTSLETAIHRLVQHLGTDEEQEGASILAEKIATAFSKDERIAANVDELKSTLSTKEEALLESAMSSVCNRSVAVAEQSEAVAVDPNPRPVQPLSPAYTTGKAGKKRSSFFGMLSPSKSKNTRKLGKKNETAKKKRISFFGGSKKSSAKNATPAPVPETSNVVAPTPPATPIVTPAQRKAVEEAHGAQVIALLTDQQMLDLLAKMHATPVIQAQLSSEIVPTMSAAEKSASKSVSGQSATQLSTGMKEEDPHMMIVSLPSQRGIPANGSMKSTTSKKSQRSQKSEKTVPTSPRSNKMGSISPAPLSPSSAASPKVMGTTSPAPLSPRSPSGLTGAASPRSPSKGDVLLANGTYDDGFEINF